MATVPSASIDDLQVKLSAALAARQKALGLFTDYYDGKQRLAFASSKFREAFGTLFREFADNWCGIVVDASAERLQVEGFRLTGSDPEQGDDDAWTIWQRCGMDAQSDMAHVEAIKLGASYLDVGPDPDDPASALIQVVPAQQAIVLLDPAQPSRRIAGLRCWVDDEEEVERCIVYTPEEVRWYVRDPNAGATSRWNVDGEGSGGNPLGVVPLIPLANNPGLLDRQGRSDLANVIPLQDAVNKLVSDMLVASEFAAFRQRWATGIEIPGVDPETGQRMTNGWVAAVDRIWASENDAANFGTFDVTDLNNYVQAIENLIQHLAAQTRTPPHYLTAGMGQWPSGESLKASETGLVSKVRRKMRVFGEAWEQAIRLAFAIEGDMKRAEDESCEVIWRNPETRSQAETVDAATKLSTIGVPEVALWEYVGATPQQIARWAQLKEEQDKQQGTTLPEGAQVTERITLPPSGELGPVEPTATAAVPPTSVPPPQP
jgi:hypothetical protein